MSPDGLAALSPEPASTSAEASARLEFALDPHDLPALAGLPELVPEGPARAIAIVWHDNPDGDLAAQGLSLARQGKVWRLERLRSDGSLVTPAAVLDTGASPSALQPAPPANVGPVAAFEGRSRAYRAPLGTLLALHGRVRGVMSERKLCRLTLAGSPAELESWAMELTAALRLAVPRATLAAEAMTFARAAPLPPRALGAPELDPDLPVSESLAHIITHLLAVMLHWLDRCEIGTPESVHQARVATRRLRSALSLYRHAATCPELAELAEALKHCAARLGAARDWDVFLDGAAKRLAEIGQGDRRISLLLRTAARRRAEAYAELRAFIASPEFRRLEIGLACAAALRPWERAADAAALDRPTRVFGAEMLERRLKRARKAGRRIEHLPIPGLHELRKDCKKLRYAAEFFGPGFPGGSRKIFLKRLAGLQEELGELNDSAVAGHLMHELGPAGRGYAAGLVQGMATTSAEAARKRVAKTWKRFRAAPRFWTA